MITADNARGALPALVYYPFTFLSPATAACLAACLGRFVVYQPAGAKPLPWLQPWIDAGALSLREPHRGEVDEKALRTQVEFYRSWALANPQADFDYLRVAGDRMGLPGPAVPRLASEIKGKSEKAGQSKDGAEDGAFLCELFLRLAREFDQQSWEIRQHLQQSQNQQRRLDALLRGDGEEVPAGGGPEVILSSPQEDPGEFMWDRRMSAWNDLFQKDPVPMSLLVTDSAAMHRLVLEGLQNTRPMPVFRIPCADRPPIKGQDEYAPWKTRLADLFVSTLTATWDRTLEQAWSGAAQEMAPLCRDGIGTAMCRLRLVPGFSPPDLMNHLCGRRIDKANKGTANTIIGLLEPQ